MTVVNAIQGSYDQKAIEEEIISFWKENNVYIRIKERSLSSKEKFLFIDGPPYTSSGIPHIGTIWNKIIKDMILRFQRLNGKLVWDQPGYDCHGLPIEVIIEKQLGVKQKNDIVNEIGIEKFVNTCYQFAKSNAESLTKSFSDVGVMMDWSNPYYTMSNEYIGNSWKLVKRAYERGLLEEGYEVLHWCPRCETTLADYEVSEYREIEDPSIYVKFRLENEDKYLLIWTTTPWTIPSNVSVMIDPDFEYCDVRINKEILIIACRRVEEVMRESNIKDYEIIRRYSGQQLLGMKYIHPLSDLLNFQRNISHTVIDGKGVVTLEEGTGLVHSAPGHGDVDFMVGKKYSLPIIMLVGDHGEFLKDAGKYAGKSVRETNDEIISDLKERNALFKKGKIVHNYPVCWRCKTPLILRATNQWFFRVTRLKEEILREINRVNWIPQWGKSRIENMVKELRDWVVSRQRYWGTPLPIWKCINCKNTTVVGSLEELKVLALNKVPENLHRPWIDEVKIRCNECGGVMERVQDVADVWFDSGVAFYASLGEELWKKLGLVDLVVEGNDQLRGWFFSMLRSNVIMEDKTPYTNVLVHGMMLDENGREMHKSLGNYIEPSTVIEKYSRDVLRLWLLRNQVWEDVKFSWKALEQAKKELQIVWNTFVFASVYMNLDNFQPDSISIDDIKSYFTTEDKYLLSRFNSIILKLTNSMNEYKIHEYTNLLIDFIVNDISRFYLKVSRKRAWKESNEPDKIAMYYILYTVLKNWLVLASPVIPFISEKLYQTFTINKKISVMLEELPKIDISLINSELEKAISLAREISILILNARAKANIKLRWPIKEVNIYVKDLNKYTQLEQVKDVILSLINAKQINFLPITEFSKIARVEVEPNVGPIGKDFKRMSKEIIDYISTHQNEIYNDIINKGTHKVILDDKEFLIKSDHLVIKEILLNNYVASSSSEFIVAIRKEVSYEEETEGIIRDIIRRIQFMRKKLNLNITDYIVVGMSGPKDRIEEIKKFVDTIKEETRAKEVIFESEVKLNGTEWEIEGDTYIISIEKV
ncbi:isoleucine--tRNA ligase [Sulfolobales archaeon HS-7]|nr:isoleucine--tRNA ligase [Sulfolobales archaeon HS-7]